MTCAGCDRGKVPQCHDCPKPKRTIQQSFDDWAEHTFSEKAALELRELYYANKEKKP